MHQLASYSHWPQPISDNTSNPFDSNLLVRRNSACLSPYKYLHNISKHSKTNCKTQIIYLGTLSAMTPFIPLYSFPTWQVHKQQCGKVVMSGCLVVQDLTKALPRHGGQIGDGESGLRSCCQLIVSHTALEYLELRLFRQVLAKFSELWSTGWMQMHIPEFCKDWSICES